MDRTHALAAIVAANPSRIPNGFVGNATLFAAKLGEMTATTYCAIMFVGWMAWCIWHDRRECRWNEPATLFRTLMILGAIGMMLRTGGEATLLWSWTSTNPITTASVIIWRNWSDLVGVSFYLVFMALAVLVNSAMVGHLKRRPFPLRMWEQWRKLVRPLLVVACSLGMAVAVLFYR